MYIYSSLSATTKVISFNFTIRLYKISLYLGYLFIDICLSQKMYPYTHLYLCFFIYLSRLFLSLFIYLPIYLSLSPYQIPSKLFIYLSPATFLLSVYLKYLSRYSIHVSTESIYWLFPPIYLPPIIALYFSFSLHWSLYLTHHPPISIAVSSSPLICLNLSIIS
jgi:hypothetical protein